MEGYTDQILSRQARRAEMLDAETEAGLARAWRDHGDKAAYQVAELCTWRGEFDLAFEWLERAFAQRDPGLNQTATDPLLRPLHGDPRWLPFMKKMGFI